MARHLQLTIDGVEYVAVPVAEYQPSVGGKAPARHDEDGVRWARESLGADLKRAREAAGLSQVDLAKRLGKSQVTVSRAESGDMSVGEKYAASVLKACGLPEDWAPDAEPEGVAPAPTAKSKNARGVHVTSKYAHGARSTSAHTHSKSGAAKKSAKRKSA